MQIIEELSYKKEDHEILKKISRIKENCPHFYITGTSVSAVENFGFQVAKEIEEQRLLPFKGLVKHFTIKMPYYDDDEGANKFLAHLRNSYSIARDCYDSYCGIILLELSSEWVRNGYNSSLAMFLDYMRDCSQVCFIILAPGTVRESENTLYSEFIKCGVWMKMQPQAPSIAQCMDYFHKEAEKHGFRVSSNANKALEEKLKDWKDLSVEDVSVIQQFVKQLYFNRSIEKNMDKVINAEDISFIPVAEPRMPDKTIGFVVKNR